MAANVAVLIGLPILLVSSHELSSLEVGLTMLPGAISTSVFGVLAGRLTDRNGARLPTWMGAPLMLLAVLGAGFGLVNTPLAATASRIVRNQVLASAMPSCYWLSLCSWSWPYPRRSPAPLCHPPQGTPFRSGLSLRPPTAGWPPVRCPGCRSGWRTMGFSQHRRVKPRLQELQLTTAEYTIKHQRKAWRGIDGMQNGQRSRAGWVDSPGVAKRRSLEDRVGGRAGGGSEHGCARDRETEPAYVNS